MLCTAQRAQRQRKMVGLKRDTNGTMSVCVYTHRHSLQDRKISQLLKQKYVVKNLTN